MPEELDEIDDEQEAADNEWFEKKIFLPIRRCVVRSLLAGNDTQCFTTEHYKAAWFLVVRSISFTTAPPYWAPGAARRHIQSTGLVEEVELEVWRAK